MDINAEFDNLDRYLKTYYIPKLVEKHTVDRGLKIATFSDWNTPYWVEYKPYFGFESFELTDWCKCGYCGSKMMVGGCTNYECYMKNWGRDFYFEPTRTTSENPFTIPVVVLFLILIILLTLIQNTK
jgi:hypothetical protein